jgi:hypothetical protein
MENQPQPDGNSTGDQTDARVRFDDLSLPAFHQAHGFPSGSQYYFVVIGTLIFIGFGSLIPAVRPAVNGSG